MGGHMVGFHFIGEILPLSPILKIESKDSVIEVGTLSKHSNLLTLIFCELSHFSCVQSVLLVLQALPWDLSTHLWNINQSSKDSNWISSF